MRKSMRMLALVLSFVMVLGLFPVVHAETAPQLANADDVVVYYTNDVHTYIDGSLSYDNIADLKTETAKQAAGVLLVDAGDAIQGTAYGSMDKGKTIIELMNAAKYDLATLGNHEFDYGMEGRINVTDVWAKFPYVSANFYHEKDGVVGESVLDAYKVFEVGGKKIAFIGITTPESFTKSTPAYFQNENGEYIYGIAGGTDGQALYTMVQTAIDAASQEADLVIALGHLGDDKASQPWTSEELIANTSGLDAFIDGHSHSTVPMKEVTAKDGSKVILTQTGEYFGAIGKMVIAADGTISTSLVTEWTGSDASVKAIKDAWMTEIDTQLGQIIGTAEITFDNYDENGNRIVRKMETNTGDFCADALYYLFDNMGLDVDVAIMNGGGVRNKAITGELSYKTMKEIHTFGNVACLQTVTGQQIVDALEWGARQAPEVEVGGFLHVAGLRYTVDGSVVSSVQADDKGVWTGAPTGEYRVKNVEIFNKTTGAFEPIDLTASYNLAGYNYTLRDLGDGFAMFDGAVNVLDYVMEDYMVLANYVQGFENATVKGTNSPLNVKFPTYGADYSTTAGSGRITVSAGETAWDGKITIGGLDNNIWMTKYGNVYTDCAAENFTEDLGLAWGDLVTVKFLGQELILPVVPTYSYVDSGKPAIILNKNDKGNADGYVSLAINMGNFAETYGIATKHTDENKNWWWEACEGVEFPIEVSYELYEKEGYMAEYLLHELTRTNNREDYAHLTDAQFANFRKVATTGMGNLYRSSSPINPEIGRNTYAMAEVEKAGVTVVMNLADNAEEAAAYAGFAESYYAGQKVIFLGLGVDFAAADFQAGLANGLRFFAENPGTYLVHCNEGKDRAGFVSAVLECLMGASAEEVVADYMVTYYNYYGVEPGTEKYNAIASSNIIKSLQTAFGIEDLYAADLAAEAAEYIAAIGLTEAEIAALKANLTPAPASTDVVIYYTNDVHTYIDGTISYDNLAWLKANTDAAQVLLVDAGDAIQGTAYGSMDKGETIIKLMNAAGYDLATLGNHEFDYGMTGAMNAIAWANYPYVSSNFYHESNGVIGDTVLDAYKVFETANGLKIAFVGITTPESFTKSTPAYFQNENGEYIYGIAGGTDGQALYAAVQKAIDAASAEADIVIALGHLGDDPASQPWTSEEVIANTSGLDAFIDGHSHSTVPMKEVTAKDGSKVILTQTGEYFGAIGKMTVTAEGNISTELVTEVSGSDAAVKAIKDEWMTEIDTKLGEVIGHLDVTLDNYDETGRLVRKMETNTGAFAADALYYLFDNMGLDVDVAIMNGGGVRNKTITGDFSYKTAKEIHTFGNVACLQTITGQQLLDALEWGAKNAGSSENGGFLHVSGLTYEIHTYIPSTVQADEKGVWTGAPTGEYRVKNVKILQNGEYVDLDLNASYNLAGYNYTLRDLGDGFAMFDGAVNVLDYVMEDYMVLANYIKSFPVDETTGLPTVTAENSPYGNLYGTGRIKAVAFTDVAVDSFFYESVQWALNKGITNGATATTFNPGGDLLRAQVVTMLWRAAGEPAPATTVNPFTDVAESDFFYNAVLWAVENGITNGISATEFGPYGVTNRAQAVTFLWRWLGEPDAIRYNPFTDVQKGQWYEDPINWAVQYGITNGISATEFGINANCNRAHMVTFLYRVEFPMAVEPLVTYSLELKSNDPSEELGLVMLAEEGPFVAGQPVVFFADPAYGYLVEFTVNPVMNDLELNYLGAGTYELIMPECDLALTANFVPAAGKSYKINTTCTNGFAMPDCEIDDNLNDIAKAGEYITFVILPDEGYSFADGGFSAKVGGKVWDYCWFLGEFPIEDLGTVYAYEMVMPEGNVDVTISCTKAAAPAAAAEIRIPVTVR